MNKEFSPLDPEHILEKLDSIEKRLFGDNGTLSIQTRLDRHEQILRGLIWAVSVVGGVFLASTVALTVYVLKVLVLNLG